MNCPVPHNELERLDALYRLQILNSEPTPQFDAIVNMAAAIFEAPIALISFLDRDVQWFKARVGLDVSGTSRHSAFCTHTILSDDILEIEDARLDPRFSDNDFVTGYPHLRYYIGAPISIDGRTNVATLCVIDTKPGKATATQRHQFDQLRIVVAGLIDAHVTAAKAGIAEQHARQRGTLLAQVEKISKIGAWSLDTASLKFEWSPQIFAIHELDGDQAPALEEALAFFPDYEREAVTRKLRSCAESGTPFELESDFITARGTRKRIRAIGEIERRDDGATCLIGILKDITDQYEQDKRLWRAAHLDSLTGIANRHSFQGEIERRLAGGAADAVSQALLILDLDNFKDINDDLGHLAGDEVLCEVARRIARAIPDSAFCARLGGDEFAVLVKVDAETGTAEDLASILVREISAPITYGQQEVRVSTSIGIATGSCHAIGEDELFLRSDLALYHVKQTGRGKVQSYEPAITQAIEEKKRSVTLIRSAIAEARLEPFYQPIVDLRTRGIRGLEALARVRNAGGAISGPADFWHALLDGQCAREIDEVILDRALIDMARWRRIGLDIDFISVNASSSSIQSGCFVEQVFTGLARNGLSPRDLKIEVVESVFLGNDSSDVRQVLEQLSAGGVRIALDDFGTGYASLSHLRDYPIDCIKIDKSFVLGLGGDSRNTAIVQALIGLGKSMNLRVIAEGIETPAQLDFVSALGSHYGQGYLFSKPMDAESMELLMTAAAAKPTPRAACGRRA
ncbi:hypothetical protein LL06_09100 [Hoeflea sp. BAL378]|uniref:sensor domain-containing phosphodiesterase n=1 Tax=Hoeflea sp. BAL378 TaxID=1547437 RepID=UPI000513D337|nr:EAL domain-containing protein [Hoeflea sp. BAL378]KGF69743.1 hypothetical protein LL06_09100 [Hoeflea sp. BAL378]